MATKAPRRRSKAPDAASASDGTVTAIEFSPTSDKSAGDSGARPRFELVPDGNGRERELRKATEAIAIQPKSGRLTLLTRKIFNALLYAAQQQGEHVSVYRIPLSQLVANAAFTSNDTALVKEHIRKMVTTLVEWNTVSEDHGRRWGVSSLISEAEIIEDIATRRTFVEFGFGAKIKGKLLDPEVYSRFNLRLQAELRSSASLALYEICSRYLGNPSHLTMRRHWSWWRPALTGVPDVDPDAEITTEYKYFKRDVIKGAVTEINSVTDIEIELIEHRDPDNRRKVGDLQFRVTPRQQGGLDLSEPKNLIDSNLIARMRKLGLSDPEATKLYGEHEEDYLRSVVDQVEMRLRSTTLPPINSPAAFLKDALRKRYVVPKTRSAGVARLTQGSGGAEDAGDARAKLAADYARHQAQQAERMFAELGNAAQSALQAEFESSILPAQPANLKRAYRERGLSAPMVGRGLFFPWLARKTWGEPGAEDLLAFSLGNERGAE